MSEPNKNPFEAMLDAFRQIVREELAAAGNGNGHAAASAMDKRELKRLKILADAKAIVDAGALLTAEHLAVMLEVNKATIYEWVKSNSIPYYQAGRFVRFNLQEVLEAQRKPA